MSTEFALQESAVDVPIGQTQKHEGMVRVPAGWFLMGSDDGGDFEQPVHRVWLDGFLIDAHPVTNRQFADFVCRTGYLSTAERKGSAWGYKDGLFSEVPGLCWRWYASEDRAQHPVVMVSWYDACAYARWLGKRLPTEAEWEKAARGGLDGKLYPWGHDDPTLARTGYGKPPQEVPPTSSVGSFPANGYGLYDVVGNVWQWCADWYDAGYYSRSPERNPSGPELGEFRTRRGASWNIIQTFRLRCANRGAVRADTAVANIGFRCALSP